MSRPISITSAVTFTPASFASGSYAGITGQTTPVGQGSGGTTYATVNLTTGASAKTYAFWKFDCSTIPSNATINSVTCYAKAYVSNTNSNRVATRQVNLYSAANTGSTKGTAQTVSNSASVLTIPGGTWTRSQLDNCYVGLYGVRGTNTSYTSTTYYFRFYGADLLVNYTVNGTAYEITATSTYAGATVSPATQEVINGESAVVQIYPDDLNKITVEDNGTDVTSQLQYVVPTPGTQTFTGIPTSYDATNSVYDGIYTGATSDGLAPNTSTSRFCVYVAQTANAEGKLTYNFDCSSIPSNATITSVSCVAAAACYSSGQYFNTRTLQLYSGNTAKGTATTITGNGGTRTDHNINGGSWTRSELDNIKIVIRVQRGTDTTQASFSFWGATLTVQYTLPEDPYYTYTITGVSADHSVVVSESIIVPPEEDPTKTYYSVTISSINAITEPGRGTTRVESGTSETITITPSDPQLTLALDNGVDVSSQLVHHGSVIQDPTVATAQGASYGFTYCGTTGYYTSTNQGVASSAAVSRVTFNLPVSCLITIEYINYAEATYDYGIFGNIDTALSTTSGSDTNAKLVCNTSTYNQASPQTLTYEMQSGTHYIDIKYRKDTYTDSNNDTLQFKIANIEPLEANDYYTYSLSGIAADHSLVFIFGNVSYYFVTSSTDSTAKLYPDGQMVELAGDTYKLTIVPENTGDTITLRDNNVDVTNSLVRKEEIIEKGGQQITVVNYIYTLTNVQTGHTLVAFSASAGDTPFFKVNGSWVHVSSIWKKINGSWQVQEPVSTDIFDDGTLYVKGN